MRPKLFRFLSSLFIVLLLSVAALNVSAQAEIPNPPHDGRVLDNLGWFTSAQKTELNTLIMRLDTDTTAEIAVVTLNDCGDDHPKFRNDLFRTWGIGKKSQNNGFLLLVCWQDGSASRTIEQEVGYGLEGVLTDTFVRSTSQQNFNPIWPKKGQSDTEAATQQVISSGKAAEALITIIKAYDTELRKYYADPQNYKPEAASGLSRPFWLGLPLWFWLLVALVIIIFAAVVRSTRIWRFQLFWRIEWL